MEVLDRHLLRLPQAIAAIFGLCMIGRHPVQVLEDHVRARRQRDADAAGDDVADRNLHRRIRLEAVDSLHALLAIHVPGDADSLLAQVLQVLLNTVIEGREHDHLLTRGHDIANAFGDCLVLSLVQRHAHLGEPCEELRVIRLRRIRRLVPDKEALDGIECGRRTRHIDRHPRADLRRQVQHLVLRPAQHHFLHQEVEFLDVGRASRHPAIVIPVGIAVALGKAQEGTRRGMPHAAQQVEEVPWPVRHRCPRQQEHIFRTDQRRLGLVRHAHELEAVRGALARILDEVSLVQDHARPVHLVQAFGIRLQQVIVDDHPARALDRLAVEPDHLDACVRIDHQDLAPPVQLQRGRTDHEDRPIRHRHIESDDRLACLAKTHVVPEDRALLRQEERHAIRLVRIEKARPDALQALHQGHFKRRHERPLSCELLAVTGA